MKKPRTTWDIESEFQKKVTAKQYYLQIKYTRRKETGYSKIDDVEEEKKNKELQRYIKKYETKRDQQLKNFERESKGRKIITYKKPNKEGKINKTILLDVLQLLSKVRDAGPDGMIECISCPSVLHRWEMSGTHYETRENNATAFNLHNIHAGCSNCNMLMMMGGLKGAKVKSIYKIKLIKKIGEAEYNILMDTVESAYGHTVDIPDKRRLKEIYDWAIEQIIAHINKKNLQLKKGTLAYKIMKPYLHLLSGHQC